MNQLHRKQGQKVKEAYLIEVQDAVEQLAKEYKLILRTYTRYPRRTHT